MRSPPIAAEAPTVSFAPSVPAEFEVFPEATYFPTPRIYRPVTLFPITIPDYRIDSNRFE